MPIRQITTFIVLCVVLSVSSNILAAESNLTAAFEEKFVGARPLALGGAYTSLADDPLALIWNPAQLQNLSATHSIITEHSQILGFYEYSFIGYGRKIGSKQSFGIGFLHSGDEVMSESIGYISVATDLAAISALFDRIKIPVGKTSFGLTTKYFHSSFGKISGVNHCDFFGTNHRVFGSANGFGIDAGFTLLISENDRLATCFKNLYSVIKWDSNNEANTALGSYNETPPIDWRIGYTRLSNRWTGTVEINKSLYQDTEDNIYAGGEYVVACNMKIRCGYSQELVTAENKRFSAGLGLKISHSALPPVVVDIAYLIHSQWKGYRSLFCSLQIPITPQ